jgi:hypothetical protein
MALAKSIDGDGFYGFNLGAAVCTAAPRDRGAHPPANVGLAANACLATAAAGFGVPS